jgi:hypothetical protein
VTTPDATGYEVPHVASPLTVTVSPPDSVNTALLQCTGPLLIVQRRGFDELK